MRSASQEMNQLNIKSLTTKELELEEVRGFMTGLIINDLKLTAMIMGIN